MEDYKRLSTYLEAQQLRQNKYQHEGMVAIAALTLIVIGMLMGMVTVGLTYTFKPAKVQTVYVERPYCQFCHYPPSIRNLRQYKARHQIKPPNLAELSH